jgi:hypothetical protein
VGRGVEGTDMSLRCLFSYMCNEFISKLGDWNGGTGTCLADSEGGCEGAENPDRNGGYEAIFWPCDSQFS